MSILLVLLPSFIPQHKACFIHSLSPCLNLYILIISLLLIPSFFLFLVPDLLMHQVSDFPSRLLALEFQLFVLLIKVFHPSFGVFESLATVFQKGLDVQPRVLSASQASDSLPLVYNL